MDQPALPTAAELGIDDAEYQVILRDMQRRTGFVLPPAADAAQPRQPISWRVPVAVLAIIITCIAFRPHSDPDPVYAFGQSANGRPVTYTSCRPIQVAVYPAGGPPGAEQLVRDAVVKMRSATGLDIVVVGAFGGHAPNWNFKAGPTYPEDPISVSWQDGQAIAEMNDNVAGLGGSRTITGPGGTARLVAGTIALSRDVYASLTERNDHDEALAILLHEFGHVFGLAHVDSENELMNADNTGRTTFGAGDLQGLRLLGKGPCT